MADVEVEVPRPDIAILRLKRPARLDRIVAGASGGTEEAARAFVEKR